MLVRFVFADPEKLGEKTAQAALSLGASAVGGVAGSPGRALRRDADRVAAETGRSEPLACALGIVEVVEYACQSACHMVCSLKYSKKNYSELRLGDFSWVT